MDENVMKYEKLINYAEFLLFFIVLFIIVFIITEKISTVETDKRRKLKEIRLENGYYNAITNQSKKDFDKNVDFWLFQRNHESFKAFLSKKIEPASIKKTDIYEIPFKEGM